MTKAKARKRLDEASKKVINVYFHYEDLSPADITKIETIHRQLRKMVMKLK